MEYRTFARIGGIAAGAAALVIAPAIAFADGATENPLMTPTCTYEQVVAALDPAAVERLDAHPLLAERLRATLALTPEERKAKVAEFKKNHPGVAERLAERPEAKTARAALHEALETCGE